MIPVQPSFLAQPFAQSGDKNIIPNTGGDLLGNASLALGFPKVTETPLELGGVPPQRRILTEFYIFCLRLRSLHKVAVFLHIPQPQTTQSLRW